MIYYTINPKVQLTVPEYSFYSKDDASDIQLTTPNPQNYDYSKSVKENVLRDLQAKFPNETFQEMTLQEHQDQ